MSACVSWLSRVSTLSANRLTSDKRRWRRRSTISDGYRQRYLDTQNAMQCSKTAEIPGRSEERTEAGFNYPKENASATNQLNLYPKDTTAAASAASLAVALHPGTGFRRVILSRSRSRGQGVSRLTQRKLGKQNRTDRIGKELSI